MARRAALWLIACATACSPQPQAPVGERLDAQMDRLQRRTSKLGLAIDARNLRLAAYYLETLDGSLDAIAASVPEQDGYPIARLIDQVARPALAPLDEALTVRSWPRVEAAYGALIETCNACHAATERDYLVMLPASEARRFDQRFTTAGD